MLRITASIEGSTTTLRVEGKLRRHEVTELEGACQQHLGRQAHLVLELSAVSFLDESGVEAVRNLARRGARIQGCSPLVAGLLKEAQE